MFRNSGNSRTSDAHSLKLNLMDKMNLPRDDNSVVLSDLSICKEYKKVIQEQWIKNMQNNRGEEFELPHGSICISYTQDYFECIIKKHETFNDKPPVQIYVNEVTMKIKSGYYLQLLAPMNLLRSTEQKMNKDRHDKMYCV